MSVNKAERLYVNIVTYKLKDIAVKPAYVVTCIQSHHCYPVLAN